MRSFCVIGNRGKLQVMIRLIVLILLEEQMHKTCGTGFLQLKYGKKSSLKIGKTMPCQFFNPNSSSHSSTHETRGVLYKHICAYCFTSANKTFSHSEMDCRNKKKVN